MKQHIVSEFLTRQWEHKKGSLKYFDTAHRQILEESSQRLFSSDDLWPDALEQVFNKHFESRLANEIREVAESISSDVELPWEKYRAYVLMLVIHMLRLKRQRLNDDLIQKFSGLSKDELDHLIRGFSRDFVVLRLPTSADDRLFFTDTGYFGFPLLLKKEIWFHGSALPIHPNCALAALHPELDREWLKAMINQKGWLRGFSAGNKANRKIAVHPTDIDHLGGIISAATAIQRIQSENEGWTVTHNGRTFSVIELIEKRREVTGSILPT